MARVAWIIAHRTCSSAAIASDYGLKPHEACLLHLPYLACAMALGTLDCFRAGLVTASLAALTSFHPADRNLFLNASRRFFERNREIGTQIVSNLMPPSAAASPSAHPAAKDIKNAFELLCPAGSAPSSAAHIAESEMPEYVIHVIEISIAKDILLGVLLVEPCMALLVVHPAL